MKDDKKNLKNSNLSFKEMEKLNEEALDNRKPVSLEKMREQAQRVKQEHIEYYVLKAISNLDIESLYALDENVMYSNLTKDELIKEFKCVFEDLKFKGISELTFERSKCICCERPKDVFSFYYSSNGNLITKYLISKGDEANYNIHLYNGNCTSEDIDAIPF